MAVRATTGTFDAAPLRYDHMGRREPSFAAPARAFDGDSSYIEFDTWGTPSTAGTRVSQITAMQVTAVWACVSIISSDLAKLGVSVFQGKRKGAHNLAKSHPLYPLLQRPNDWMTSFEFIQMMQISVLLRGNGYAVILRDWRGRPIMLVPINPDKVQLWESPDGRIFYLVTRTGLHEMAVLRELPLLIPAEDIFHLKSMSANGLVGLSPIALEREAIGLALAQEQMAGRWAANGAHMSGTLNTDQKLTPEIRDRSEARWQNMRAGLGNVGRTAILEAGLKFTPLSLKLVDMEFLASRQYQDEQIARIFRVPLYMISETKGSGKSGIATLAQEYINYTLSTPIKMWEQRLEFTFDIDPDELFVDFDEDRLLEADIATRYAANRIALGGMPWETINQVRAKEGLPPVEDGDIIWRPVNMAPLDSDVFEANADPADKTVPGDDNEPDPADPNAPGLGSDQTGLGADGGGRPPADGGDAAGQAVT